LGFKFGTSPDGGILGFLMDYGLVWGVGGQASRVLPCAWFRTRGLWLKSWNVKVWRIEFKRGSCWSVTGDMEAWERYVGEEVGEIRGFARLGHVMNARRPR
jgi:hypothetical protein